MLVAAAVAVALLAGDGGDRARPDTPLPSVEGAADRVEFIREERFERVPVLDSAGASAMEQMVRRTEPRLPPARKAAEELLLTLTGMATAAELRDMTDWVVYGLYESRDGGRVHLLRDMVRYDPKLAESVLAHELVHDLDDERFGTGDEPPPLFDDRGQAWLSVVEGHANYVEALYRIEHLNWAPPVTNVLRLIRQGGLRATAG